MAKKRPKSDKSRTRKKPAASSSKRPPSTPPHHGYEDKIYDAVNGMLTDVQAILIKLNRYDKNRAPTGGIIAMIEDLINEFEGGAPAQADHDNSIEECLYALAGIEDQYNIDGGTPDTDAVKPQPGSHENRVAQLLTTINSVTRDVFELLDSKTLLKPPPKLVGDDTKNIVALALDTQTVVGMIRHDIHAFHVPPIVIFSK